ncbi:hypothetical protein [Deinococcus maricopensis]|uniref:Lipoprotein n=1 Tax=Deinococcus maricopensis (strain DSM 21211 / LMG 22137 / NRRL B-23946 / LB-34) TaxID=709986 RepID=E8U6X2_DEIML|nr:hypothetical protein [Deinococcus maricopensis]ADV66811.1 hypothetical protein Deima_1159 [Deinococcus maricopensis DSM 21211]
MTNTLRLTVPALILASALSACTSTPAAPATLGAQATTSYVKIAGHGQNFTLTATTYTKFWNGQPYTTSAERSLPAGTYNCGPSTYTIDIADGNCYAQVVTQTFSKTQILMRSTYGAEWQGAWTNLYTTLQLSYAGYGPTSQVYAYNVGYTPTDAEYTTARTYWANHGLDAQYLSSDYRKVLWAVYRARTSANSSGFVGTCGLCGFDFYVQ